MTPSEKSVAVVPRLIECQWELGWPGGVSEKYLKVTQEKEPVFPCRHRALPMQLFFSSHFHSCVISLRILRILN